ncbi:hypothetical protein THIOKS12330073 [Thiocapsa sp. KS1]|jgi:3'-phosphoadenosine 5'-phosphosulfate sulfotransferase (PAPS reductase)/FAD synthetase|nr:hypothetical protein THIOKS12330073 [Thiocapsa sp. KS1]
MIRRGDAVEVLRRIRQPVPVDSIDTDALYVSVGDWHSTDPPRPGMSAEQTRFFGLKRACGLHE